MIDLVFVDNSFFLRKLYPDGLNIEGEISEVVFSNEGPSLIISFHLKKMPKEKPKKWSQKTNTILLTLEFIEFDSFEFNTWGTKNSVKLDHKKEGKFHSIDIKGDNCNLKFQSKWINMKKISPYVSM